MFKGRKGKKLNQIFAVLLVLCLCIGLVPIHAQENSSNELDAAADVTGLPGSTVKVPVTLTSEGDAAGLQFELAFDPALLEYEGITAGSDLPGDYEVDAEEVGDDRVRVVLVFDGAVMIPAGASEVAVLTFQVEADAEPGESCSLLLAEVMLTDDMSPVPNPIEPVGLNHGSFMVQQEEAAAELTVANVTGLPGSTVEVPVTLTSEGDAAGLQFELAFDPDLLAYQGITAGSDLPGDFSVDAEAVGVDRVRAVLVFDGAGLIPAGASEVAVLTFQIAADAEPGESCPLLLEEVLLTDDLSPVPNPIEPVGLNHGSFTVVQSYTLTVSIEEGQGSTEPAVGEHTYPAGTIITLTATAAEGHVFSKWEVNSEEVAAVNGVITLIMDSDKTATAYFQRSTTPRGGSGGGVVSTPVDRIPPEVKTTDPENEEVEVPLDQQIIITFTEKVKAGPAYEEITLKDKDDTSVDFAGEIKDELLTITPDQDFVYNTLYTVHLPAGAVEDLAGNKLEEDYNFCFTTKCISFTDMPGHWAERAVQRLACLDLISGYPDKTFRPDNYITRLEAAVLLVKMLDLNVASAADIAAFEAGFTDAADVPEWGLNRAAAAYRDGLVKGYLHLDGSRTFAAAKNISREELALIISRILENELGPVIPAEVTFTDAGAISPWAAEGVGKAVARDIVAGYPDNTFRPQNNVTRAETASMLEKLYDNLY